MYAGGKIDQQEYVRFKICEKMKWDYETYERQPRFFIEQISKFLELEASAREFARKEAENREALNK